MKELTIDLGARSYPIRIDHEVAAAFPDAFARQFGRRRCALVTNTTLAELYQDQLAAWRQRMGCVTVTVDDGEQYKTVTTWGQVLDALLRERLDRQSVIVAFGGGVVGDITGFAASALLRGVDF
ncbi:MAG: 3-dehydroquinate synthase, partial [Chitinivibrionales bacterium]|nr:3-dehydroquinate synthase [Chitinivibrionales bacterium]